MTTDPTFSVDAFCNSDDPWAYITQIGLANGGVDLSEEQLMQLHEALPSLNECRLAYALVIAEHSRPSQFGHVAAGLLRHASMSVRINAYRVLRAIPEGDLSESLVERVEQSLKNCPERKEFADAVHR